ncbi:MAG: hypothetical protein PHO30_00450 [Candidatus Omnitrophica bacterium]|nr:hypothetical protein [Candidatus Omnitrophota bacterium]
MVKTVVYSTKQKIRWVEYTLKGRSCLISKEAVVPVPQPLFDVNTVKTALREKGVVLGAVLSCFFRYEVSVRFFSFPSHDLPEIARMVNYEAADLLPIKPEETITRFVVLDSRANGYADTFVVVAHKEEVMKQVERLREIGLNLEAVYLSSLALFHCLRFVDDPDKSCLSGRNVIVAYYEDSVVEILIISDGKLVLSRGFLVDQQKNLPQVLSSEIRHSIESFLHMSREKAVQELILGGWNTDLSPVAAMLKEYFDIPVRIEPRLDIACGLAVSGEQQVNLLSDEFLAKKVFKRIKRKLILTTALLLVNVVIAGAIFMVSLHNKKTYLAMLEERFRRLKPEADMIMAKLQKLQMVKQQVSAQILILDAVTDLVNLTSSSCVLNMLSINENGSMVVRGQTDNLQDVLDFVSKIEKSTFFRNGRLNYSSRRKIKDNELLDFEIQAELNREQ